jgi:CMD domain protein
MARLCRAAGRIVFSNRHDLPEVDVSRAVEPRHAGANGYFRAARVAGTDAVRWAFPRTGTPHDMTDTATPDVIDQLLGIQPGDRLDQIRAGRLQARIHSQHSYMALFEPQPPLQGAFSLAERYAVATFVAGLHRQADMQRFYSARLSERSSDAAWQDALASESAAAAAPGPFGRFPAGPLSRENSDGAAYVVSAAARAVLGGRLAAALDHARLLVLHPRDASASALQALLDAGWSTTEIVTLSQLVSFLSFQIRVVAGLRLLATLPAQADEEVAA